MEPQGDQGAYRETRRIDGSFDMSSSEFRTFAAEIGGSLNTATDALLGPFEPLRTHPDAELLPPLDDILNDIYDRTSFTPTSMASLPYPMVSNPSQIFLPNFTSPTRNLTYANFINNEVPYEGPCSNYGTSYMPSVGQNYIPSPAVQMPMSMPVPMQPNLVSLPEEDNDQSPVYLNFNIGTMPPPSASFQKYQQQATSTIDMGSGYPENNLRYMEYLNESGETARARFFDNSVKGFRDYRTHRQNTMNAMNKIQFGQPNIEGCSKYIYATESNPQTLVSSENPLPEENSFVVKQNSCESINTTSGEVQQWTTVTPKTHTITYSEEPDILICRPPLQTKRSSRENPQISLHFPGGDGNDMENVIGLEYIALIDNSDVQIPTMPYRATVGRMKRKQEFKIRKWEDEVSFEEPNLAKCEVDGAPYEKLRSSPICRTPIKKKRPLSEEMFLGKRKRKNSTPPSTSLSSKNTDVSDYKPFAADFTAGHRRSKTNTPTSRDSYKTRNSERTRRLLNCGSTHASSAEIMASSDSELENMPVSTSKSLKCPKCKKIFKTPRSLAIHQKRCNIPVEIESDLEITMVEYLESEKELEGTDEVSLIEPTEQTTTITVIEKINEGIIDKTSEVKEEQQLETETRVDVEENPLRRNTRSLTNLIASRKLAQNNEPKPGNGHGKAKPAKGTSTSNTPRNTRRKKSK